MDKKGIQQVESFGAITEAGETVRIIVEQHYTITEEFQAEPQKTPGSKRYRLSTGEHVNLISGDRFEIMKSTGEKIIVTRKK